MSAQLGLGLAALGRPEYLTLGHGELLEEQYDVTRLRAHAETVLDAAWAAGVRHLDAARSYGAGEEFLGGWLAAHPGRREEVRVGSKWGYTYVADFAPGASTHETKDHGLATLRRQWPETLAALGGPPDLYLVHSLTADSPVLSDGAVLEELGRLAADGVRVGLSTSGPDQAAVLLRALALPGSPFSTVQATWNLLEPSAGEALAEASAQGWLVVVKEGVANGRLTTAGRSGPRPEALDALDGLARELGCGPDAVALGAALARPWADVVLSGAATVEQLASNLAAYDVARRLAGELPGGLASVAEPPEEYWSTRKQLPWT